MQDGATPSLDMRDVNDAYSHRQHSGHPDKSRIRGFIHDDSCTYKSCAKPLTGNLISVTAARSRSIPVEEFASARGQQDL